MWIHLYYLNVKKKKGYGYKVEGMAVRKDTRQSAETVGYVSERLKCRMS